MKNPALAQLEMMVGYLENQQKELAHEQARLEGRVEANDSALSVARQALRYAKEGWKTMEQEGVG